MRKKYLLFIILTICFVIVAGTTIQAEHSNINLFYNIGQLLKQEDQGLTKSSQSEGIYARGKDITLSNEEVETHTKRLEAGGSDHAKETAVKHLIERKTLLTEAKKNLISVSQEAVEQEINNRKEELKQTDNYEDFQQLIKGYGSEDQYWSSIKNTIKESMIISEYLSKMQDDFTSGHQLNDESEVYESDTVIDTWSEHEEKIVQELIREQDVQVLVDDK